jgi:hypothetical protein
MLMKLLGFLVALILVVWFISDPHTAGHDVHNAITGLFAFLGAAGSGS